MSVSDSPHGIDTFLSNFMGYVVISTDAVQVSGLDFVIANGDQQIDLLSSIDIDTSVLVTQGATLTAQGSTEITILSSLHDHTYYNPDAFYRQRMSLPYTLFDSKQLSFSNPLLWNAYVSGAAVSAYNANTASVTLSVGATAGRALRQTRRYWNYQPGKSQLGLFTCAFGPTSATSIKRVGLFDDNNGLYFRNNGGVMEVSLRSFTTGTPVTSSIPQSAWNMDKLDGTGQSQFNLNPALANIYFIDYEWLGVGSVRFGVFYDGKPIVCHVMRNANALSKVYMSSPNLPVRYEITGSQPDSMDQICCSIITEGAESETGAIRSIDRGVNGIITLNDTNTYAVLAIRLKSDCLWSTVKPLHLSLINISGADFYWALIMNPTIVGTDGSTWVDLPNSSLQYNVSTPNTATLSAGTVLNSGYASTALNEINLYLPSAITIGHTYAGTVRDTLYLGVARVTGTTETFFGSLTVRESL